MPITVGDFQFRGPYSSLAMLESRPGVWAVLDGRRVPPVAAGTADDVRTAVENHHARACWTRRCERPAVAVFYCPRRGRREDMLRKLRSAYELPCLTDGATLPSPRFPQEPAAATPREEAADTRVA